MIYKRVNIMCGVPGSGKSTLAKTIGALGTHQIISTDEIRGFYNKDEGSQENGSLIWSVAYDRLHMALNFHDIETIYFDATMCKRKDRTKLVSFIKDNLNPNIDLDIHLFVVNTDLNTALERNSGRSRVVPSDVITNMYRALHANFPTLDEGYKSICILESKYSDNPEVSGLPYIPRIVKVIE